MGSKIFYWEVRGKKEDEGKKIKLVAKNGTWSFEQGITYPLRKRLKRNVVLWIVYLMEHEYCSDKALATKTSPLANMSHKNKKRIKISYKLRKSSKCRNIFLIFLYVIPVILLYFVQQSMHFYIEVKQCFPTWALNHPSINSFYV
jgi:hypothetical protein